MKHKPFILHINLARGWRGGEQQTWLLMENLARDGYCQALCARLDGPLAERTRRELSGIQLFSPRELAFQPWRAFSFDVAHAHEGRGVYLAWWWSQCASRPTVITRRMQDAPKNKWLTGKAYDSSAALVGISSAACAGLETMCPDKSVWYIPSAFSPSLDSHLDKTVLSSQLEIDAEAIVIGHAGALIDAHKGQRVLVDAVSQMRAEGSNIELILMGDGPERGEWEQFAEQYPWAHVVGHMAPISQYLGAIDIFAFPSRHEGLGSVLLDVMLAGIPIVASDVGGIPDLIQHQETGILVQPNDARALAEGLSVLMEAPSHASALARAAREAVERFSPHAMSDAYKSVYADVCQAS